MLKETCDLFVFAGEKSGDLHGGNILRELQSARPQVKIRGVGGPSMRAAGLDCILPMERFQVMGFVDVFLALPRLARQFYFVKKFILRTQPPVVLLIDYPGFNLRLAAHLRKAGYKGRICHYICPSVWAWGKKRIPHMAETLDMLLSILPFEKSYFSDTPLPVHYVGHPLVAAINRHRHQPLKGFSGKVLALFPGSRLKEIERNLPFQLAAAKRLCEKDHLQIAISFTNSAFLHHIQYYIEQAGLTDIKLIPPEHTYDLMHRAHLALAKSGTVTLELALHGVPTVVTYGISTLDLFIARRILRIELPYYCLVNILADENVFPELIGPNLTFDALHQAAKTLLDNPVLYADCQEKCERVKALLGREDASRAAALHLAPHLN